MKTIVLPVVLCFVVTNHPPDVVARVWGVDVNGMPGVDCDCVTIQACIDSASAGDTVEVACGTYYEHDITMKSGITLRSQIGLSDCVTIDADQLGRVMSCTDVDSTTSIVGFTLTRGHCADAGGGGLCCLRSSPVVRDCVFTGNFAQGGGGLSFGDNSSPTLIVVDFAANSAEYAGGALSCSNSRGTLQDCVFSGNTTGSDGYGGAIYTWDSALTLTRVRFEGNTARFGGGVYSEMGSPLEMSCCTFWGNSAVDYAGGLGGTYGGPATLSNCTFHENSATGPGAALYIIYDYDLIMDNTIVTSSSGPLVFCGANRSSVVASCCNMYGNENGDWVLDLLPQLGLRGNISECPRFCGPENGDFRLQECSPCAPGNHPTGYPCGLIGAYEVGCPCGEPSAVEETSWSSLKALYR